MRIESIVRKTPGLKRHSVKKVIEQADHLFIHLEPDSRHRMICSCCGNKAPGYDTLKARHWKHVPLWGIAVEMVFALRQVACLDCGIKFETIPWSQGKSPLSVPLTHVLAT